MSKALSPEDAKTKRELKTFFWFTRTAALCVFIACLFLPLGLSLLQLTLGAPITKFTVGQWFMYIGTNFMWYVFARFVLRKLSKLPDFLVLLAEELDGKGQAAVDRAIKRLGEI